MLSSGAGAQEVSGPVPVGSPADWITPDDYPPSAIRAGAEGRVVTNLGVDRAGKVTSCAVQTSSGNAALDAATCAVMTTRGTFTPAKDAGGRATPSTYDLPVRWELPSEPTATVEITEATRLNSDAVIELRLDGDGKVIGCRLLEVVLPSYADSAGDACEEFQVGTQMGPALRRNGKPVASTMVHRLTTRVTTAP
jgi:TonB family protein